MRFLSTRRFWVSMIVLLFPILSNLLEHACTVQLLLLTAMGLFFCYPADRRPFLHRNEKMVMTVFAAYFLVYLSGYLVHGLTGRLLDPRIKFIEHEFRFAAIIPVFLLLRGVRLPVRILWHSITMGAIASGVYAVIKGLILFPGSRVSGSYHAIAFGDLSLALAFMSLCGISFYRSGASKAGRLVPWVAFGLGLLASILSGTRGAWIAIPGLLVILFFQYSRSLKPWAWGAIAVGGIGLGIVFYRMPQIPVAERVQNIFQELAEYRGKDSGEGTVIERLEGWQAAWKLFQENPLLGAGPGNFKPLVLQMIGRGERSPVIGKYSQPHNAYLAVMADCGILGLIVIVSVFAVPAYTLLKQTKIHPEGRAEAFAGLVLIAAFAQFGLTETIFGRNINIEFYLVMLAMTLHAAGGGTTLPER